MGDKFSPIFRSLRLAARHVMADTFLVPCHPIAKELQAQQYIEDRNKYREQHRVNFKIGRASCRERV